MKRIFSAALFVAALLIASATGLAQSESREELLKQIEAKRAELSALEKIFLAPSAADRVAYAEFLRQPNGGLIRLLPREVYAFRDDRDKKKALTVWEGGAYYSFDRRTHDYGCDIGLEQGKLSVGFAGANYGILSNLGSVSLDDITPDHPSVRFMSAHVVPSEEPQARVEQRRFATGTTLEGVSYRRMLAAEVGASYLLRSINYRVSDVLVAFKVVRMDTDGSIIIAWKLLQKYPVPQLARN